MLTLNGTNFKDILEGGPPFINKVEQVIFTLYTVVICIIVCLTNGLFGYCLLANTIFHSPYFVILFVYAIHNIIAASTLCLTPIYISLSGHNPFRGSLLNCAIHKMFVSTPWLAACHNLCVLCVERIIFFRYPFWYSRMITNRVIIVIETIIFVVATVFSILSVITVESYFSIAAFICVQTTKRWVIIVEFTCYYFLCITLVLITIMSLFLLIVKTRRAIAIPLKSLKSTSAPSRNNQQATHLREADDHKKDVANSANRNCGQSDPNGSSCDSYEKENQTSQIKIAIKLISSISGVFWVTVFPAIVGIVFFRIYASPIDIELAISMKYRMLRRFLTYFPILSAFVNPLLYIKFNKPLKLRLITLVKKCFLR